MVRQYSSLRSSSSPSSHSDFTFLGQIAEHPKNSSTSRTCSTIQPVFSFGGNDFETILDVEMPGVKRQDVSVGVNGSKLTIIGKRYINRSTGGNGRASLDGKSKSARRDQPGAGKIGLIYHLEVQLASNLDKKNIKAVQRGYGVLRVRIPVKNLSTSAR